jgi:cytoskeletal protein CcmA (bactofilin family)
MEQNMFEKRSDNRQSSPDAKVQKDTAAAARTASPVIGKSAIIGPGISINGDISGTEGLVIEGKVQGKINLPGHQVEVGKAGRVQADVLAKFVKVDGELRGDIEGKEKVVITKSGNVRGNIVAPRVMLEDGAIFKGSIDIDPADTAPVELPLTAQKTPDNVKTLAGEGAKKDTGYTVKGR